MRGRRLRLARAEARWEAVFELAPVAMLEHDFDGRNPGYQPRL